MTPAEAELRACSLAGVELDIDDTRAHIRGNPRYPSDPADQALVEVALTEIITELGRRGD